MAVRRPGRAARRPARSWRGSRRSAGPCRRRRPRRGPSLDRLGQKLHGQTPADDAAEELAAEAADLAKAAAKPEVRSDPAARREAADDAHRLATALRGLNLPDAPAMQAEAVRLAEAAARALDAPKADAAPEVAKAAESARALADRLADRLSPRAEAQALARAERG